MAVTAVGDIRSIERVGGDLAVDFVNTLGGLPERADDEYLFRYADLLIWAEGSDLLDHEALRSLRARAERRPKEADAAFARSLELRGAVDGVLRAHLQHGRWPAEDAAAVREFYRAALGSAVLERRAGGCVWAWSETAGDLTAPLWPLAVHAVDLLRSGRLARLSRCGHCR